MDACSAGGIPSYKAWRISPCRNSSRVPASASTPARNAAPIIPIRSPTDWPDATSRSVTVNSAPSPAAHRSARMVSCASPARRFLIAASSETGNSRVTAGHDFGYPQATSTWPSETRLSASSCAYSGLPPA